MAEQHPDRVKILKKAKATKLLQENGKVIGVDYEREGKHVRLSSLVRLRVLTGFFSTPNMAPLYLLQEGTQRISRQTRYSSSIDQSITTSYVSCIFFVHLFGSLLRGFADTPTLSCHTANNKWRPLHWRRPQNGHAYRCQRH